MAKTTKKPTAKQLASRKKFAAMAKARAKAAKAKKATAKKKAVKKAKVYQTGGSVSSYDKKKKAKSPGKRVSASGGVYYERRKNRSDMPGSLLGINGAKTQPGAIRNVFMKRNLRKAGFSVPSEISTNDLQKLYKTIFGKQPITLVKVKSLLKKGVSPQAIINS